MCVCCDLRNDNNFRAKGYIVLFGKGGVLR